MFPSHDISEWQKEQEAIDNDSSLSEEEKEKKKIESTAKALDDKYFEDKRVGIAVLNTAKLVNLTSKGISEAYHKAKADGSNPELVKAVEELLNDKGTTTEANQPVQQDAPTAKEQGVAETVQKGLLS